MPVLQLFGEVHFLSRVLLAYPLPWINLFVVESTKPGKGRGCVGTITCPVTQSAVSVIELPTSLFVP